MTLWGDHLYFRKPEEWSEWPVTIHYLPVVSLELFTSSSGSVHHLPDDFEQGTLLQMPEILNVCILNYRKYLQLCVNLLRKQLTTHFFVEWLHHNKSESTEEGKRVGLWISRSISDLEAGSCIFKGHQVGNWVPDYGPRLAWGMVSPRTHLGFSFFISKMLRVLRGLILVWYQYFSSRSPKS